MCVARLLALAAFLAAATPLSAQTFAGSYVTSDGATSLSLIQAGGGAVSGSVTEGTIAMQLEGEIEEAMVSGWMSGQMGRLHFHAEFVSGQLRFTIFPVGFDGEPLHDMGQSVMFQRSEEATQQPEPAAPGAAPAGSQPGAGSADGIGDPVLVGRWVKEDTTVDPQMSVTTQLIMELHADGSFVQYGGETAGGGAGFSFRSDEGEERDVGQWRAEENVIYVRGEGLPQWTPCCRYYVEGDRMLITYDDGSREIWYRR